MSPIAPPLRIRPWHLLGRDVGFCMASVGYPEQSRFRPASESAPCHERVAMAPGDSTSHLPDRTRIAPDSLRRPCLSSHMNRPQWPGCRRDRNLFHSVDHTEARKRQGAGSRDRSTRSVEYLETRLFRDPATSQDGTHTPSQTPIPRPGRSPLVGRREAVASQPLADLSCQGISLTPFC